MKSETVVSIYASDEFQMIMESLVPLIPAKCVNSEGPCSTVQTMIKRIAFNAAASVMDSPPDDEEALGLAIDEAISAAEFEVNNKFHNCAGLQSTIHTLSGEAMAVRGCGI